MALVKSQATSSSPPSSSSSTSKSSYAYDVFLSFRGEDTRNNFTDHLYNALVNKGFLTFRDKEGIRKGKSLNPELDKAIEQSRVSIIILSENYASSMWCLDELVMILDQKKTTRHDVLPVFYDLSPSEVRKQNGRTGEAWASYEECPELKEKVKRWKAALEEVGHLSGFEADGYESVLIQDITKWVGNKVCRKPFYLHKLIGMDTRAKNIIKWMQDDSFEFISGGICGMGGIGKTTIAQFVCNENYKSFDAFCFIADVREMSKQSNGLVNLQRQLLSRILNDQQKEIYTIKEGMRMIKEAVSHKRVLLVLDDVDHIDQLNALCGMQDWFCRGSKIIITARDESLLKHCGKAFKVEELGHDHSIELFCSYAFREGNPTVGYGEHIERVVQHCRGLPLALEVIGSTLYGKSVPQWACLVKKFEEIPHKDILDKLKISYDCLQDDSDKRVFLDIACFFIGYDMSYTIKVLDGIPDTHADAGIQNLIDRYLLIIDSGNKLMMHQLVRDMGRNIVRQESPEDPGKCSRLHRYKDVYDVLKNEMGTRKIRGLTLDKRIKEDGDTSTEHVNEESLKTTSPLTFICSFFHCFGWFSSFFGRPISTTDLRINAFEKMENLRLLKLNYTHLPGCYDKFPKKLVWMCWHGFPLKSLPVELTLSNLVALDLRHSKLEDVWAGRKSLKSLKILDLSYSVRLVKTPNFLGVPSLEKLILEGCLSLIKICESIETLQKLNLLDLTFCKNLRKLPSNMHKLGSLETLIIAGCLSLFTFGLDISATCSANGQGKWWRTALLQPWVSQPCKDPEILWASLPHSLVRLSLVYCNLSDDSLPCAFNNLSRLGYLDLTGNLFSSLPDCIKSLSSLRSLALGGCGSLDSILGLPSNLQSLDLHSIIDMSLRRITFQSTPNKLDEINIGKCYSLIEIEGIIKMEPIEKVDRRIIKSLGIDIESIKNLKVKRLVPTFGVTPDPIQGIYEFGIFNTFIPGGEIPSCFSKRKKGSVISLIVPLLPNFRIQCLNICAVYGETDSPSLYLQFAIKINNKTKDLTWVYSPIYVGEPEEDKDMTWLSQWNFGNQLEGGDEIVVSIFVCGFEVKECGINIVYEEEEDNGVVSDDNNDKTYFHWNEVIGGDLSLLQLRRGTYFLCRRLQQSYYRLELIEQDLNFFGDKASLEGMCACLDLYLEF
ncbi:hypothetical protein LguiA_007534 [Lonicera macranthoides]